MKKSSIRLIPDWQLAWRFMSVQASILLAVLSGIQAEVLPAFAPLFPEDKWPWVSGTLALLIVVLRVVAQDSLEAPRAQLGVDAIGTGAAPETDDSPTMPAGRLERYIGLLFLLTLLALLLTLSGIALLAMKGGAW